MAAQPRQKATTRALVSRKTLLYLGGASIAAYAVYRLYAAPGQTKGKRANLSASSQTSASASSNPEQAPVTTPNDAFKSAAEKAQSLANISVEQQLQLYGLYKQATGSQLPKQRPSIVDMRGRAKYDAWAKVSSISADEARKRYISMVNSLLPKESEAKPMSGPGSGSGTERSMAKVVSVLETLGGSGKSWAGEENEPSYLAKHGNLSRLEALVAKEPALVDKQDSEGLAAIHWACDNGSVEMVKRLLALGCDVDLKDGEGLTPLAYAVINDYRDLALYLVKQGADIHAKDNSGESVLDMASATPELQQALQAI